MTNDEVIQYALFVEIYAFLVRKVFQNDPKIVEKTKKNFVKH